MKSIPDRWLEYKPYGTVIENTKILAFKVPLRPTINNNVPTEQRCTTALLMEAFPKLKFVIDLTNTTRYYDKNDFTSKDVGYLKIMVPGKQVPPQSCVLKFFKAMDDFLATAKDDEVIGVHCTHGLNRTGYLICRYLVQQLGWDLDDAVKAFVDARGYPIDHQDYLRKLRSVPRGQRLETSAKILFLPKAFQAARGHPIERQEYIEDLKSAPRGVKLDTSSVVLKNDTIPIRSPRKKSKPKNQSRVPENWRDHPPIVPGPFNFPPNGPRWRMPWGCPPPPPPSRVDHRQNGGHDHPVMPHDMTVPPPHFQMPGPNMYRGPPPRGPPAVRGFPDPRFRPVFPGPRPMFNEVRQRSFREGFVNGSDNFHIRKPFGTGGPVRLRDSDFKIDSYESNFCQSGGQRGDRRRMSRFSN